MKIHGSKMVIAWILLLFGFLLSGDLFCQSEKERKRNRTRILIEERSRDELRGDLAIELTGLEQGDNGFRQNTPALLYSNREASIVDRDELYKRKLSMYEEGISYDTAPIEKDRITTCTAPVKPRVTPASMFGKSSGGSLSKESSMTRVWLYAIIPVLIGVIVLIRVRKRKLRSTA